MAEKDDVARGGKHSSLEVSQIDTNEPVEKASLGNFMRIFTYSTRSDKIYLTVGSLSSVGAGVALPLMNIVFGHLVGSFTNYFVPGSSVTVQQFQHGVANNALFMVYLFIGKFVLAYISMVRLSVF